MTRLASAAALLGGAALLIWPAYLNTYPIVFSDTGSLLDMGLLPTIGWDKPFVYGPLIAALSLRLTLWLPLAAQGLLLSYALSLLERVFAHPTPSRHLLLCAALSALTAAPWFTATLMPDVFTPVVFLTLIAAAAPLPRPHRIAAIVIGAVAIAAHLSHLILAAAIVAALSLLQRRVAWRPLISLAAALLFLLASNWIARGRPAISPYGSVFALARLIADGPARAYLDRTCPEAGWELCRWRNQLTNDSDQFLWDPNSPFWADPMPLAAFAAQASRIVLGTVQTFPLRVLRNAYRDAARQLVRVRLGDTLGPAYLQATVRPRIARFYPRAELDRFDAARQTHDTLAPFAAALTRLQQATLLVALFAAAAILVAGLRSPSPRADLAALVLIALVANALSTGALSTVHDRYQARIAWILLLPLILPARRLASTATSPPPATSPSPSGRATVW